MRAAVKYLIFCLVVAMISSCAAEEQPIAPETAQERSYTIICYFSSGELDVDVAETLNNLEKLTVSKSINILGIVKWTRGRSTQYSDSSGSVKSFQYNHSKHKLTFSDYGNAQFRINDAQNIANVITWAKDKAPADEYIVMFFGHGMAYHPKCDAITRGTLYDQYYKEYTGIGTIVEAFERAQTHFSLTIFDSCLMNTMEYITELASYTDYYLASSHVSFTTYHELSLLVEGLMEFSGEQNCVLRGADYAITQEFDRFYTDSRDISDKMVTDCRAVPALNERIDQFVDIVVSLYSEQEEIGSEAFEAKYSFTIEDIDEALAASYYFYEVFQLAYYPDEYAVYDCYSFDLVDAVRRVAAATEHPDLLASAEAIVEAADQAIVSRVSRFVEGVDEVYPSVTLVNSEQWTELGFDKARYEDLAFDKATGWSRLLKRNNGSYPHTL